MTKKNTQALKNIDSDKENKSPWPIIAFIIVFICIAFVFFKTVSEIVISEANKPRYYNSQTHKSIKNTIDSINQFLLKNYKELPIDCVGDLLNARKILSESDSQAKQLFDSEDPLKEVKFYRSNSYLNPAITTIEKVVQSLPKELEQNPWRCTNIKNYFGE